MKNKFLLVNLDEEKTKKLAEVIASSTSRKILNFLADREATESELSKSLNLPISTVHYHLQKLQEGSLITSEEFHYSKKGREVNHYKLANKFIIIAPKETKGLKSKLQSILPIALVIAGISAIIEFVQRSVLSQPAFAQKTSFLAERTLAGADEAVAEAAIAPAVASSVSTLPLWAHIGLWFLIGGLSAILFYLLIEIIRRKSK